MVSSLLLLLFMEAPLPGAGDAKPAAAPLRGPADPRSGAELREAIRQTLPRLAKPSDEEAPKAAREFLALYQALEKDRQLVASQREYYRAVLRARLQTLSEQMGRKLAKEQPSPPTGIFSSANGPIADRTQRANRTSGGEILAQRGRDGAQPARPAAPGNQPARAARGTVRRSPARAAGDNAQELIDLIQATIAPQSWDVNGGPGTIRYWRNGRALVIRQTDEVHEQIGDVLQQLERASR